MSTLGPMTVTVLKSTTPEQLSISILSVVYFSINVVKERFVTVQIAVAAPKARFAVFIAALCPRIATSTVESQGAEHR
jgi:hypothetical protein